MPFTSSRLRYKKRRFDTNRPENSAPGGRQNRNVNLRARYAGSVGGTPPIGSPVSSVSSAKTRAERTRTCRTRQSSTMKSQKRSLQSVEGASVKRLRTCSTDSDKTETAQKKRNQSRDEDRHASKESLLEQFQLSDFSLTSEELADLLKKDPRGEHLFDDFLKSPVKAVLLHYLNSGLFSFDRWKEYSVQFADQPITDDDKKKLRAEILDELLSDDELLDLLERFFASHSYAEKHLFSCGACGVRQWERSEQPLVQYERYFLDDNRSSSPLRYTKEEESLLQAFKMDRGGLISIPIDDNGETRDIEIWRALSVFHDSSKCPWHIHPELVEVDETTGRQSTMLCPDCSTSIQSGNRPRSSVAAGLDFGYFERLGLCQPNLHEQLMLSRTRLFFAAIKVKSNRRGQCNFNVKNLMKCHAILFPSQEAEVVAYLSNPSLTGDKGLLDITYLKHLLSLFCIDDKGEADRLMLEVFRSKEIIGRSWVLAQWILVLQRLNRYYRDIDASDTVKLVEDVKTTMEKLKVDILQQTSMVKDKASIDFENHLGSDVTQNQQREVSETEQSPDDSSGGNQRSMRYTYVTNKESAYLTGQQADRRFKAMSELADLNSSELRDHIRFQEGSSQEHCLIENMAFLQSHSSCSEDEGTLEDTCSTTITAESEFYQSPSIQSESTYSDAIGQFSDCDQGSLLSNYWSALESNHSDTDLRSGGSVAVSEASLSQYSGIPETYRPQCRQQNHGISTHPDLPPKSHLSETSSCSQDEGTLEDTCSITIAAESEFNQSPSIQSESTYSEAVGQFRDSDHGSVSSNYGFASENNHSNTNLRSGGSVAVSEASLSQYSGIPETYRPQRRQQNHGISTYPDLPPQSHLSETTSVDVAATSPQGPRTSENNHSHTDDPSIAASDASLSQYSHLPIPCKPAFQQRNQYPTSGDQDFPQWSESPKTNRTDFEDCWCTELPPFHKPPIVPPAISSTKHHQDTSSDQPNISPPPDYVAHPKPAVSFNLQEDALDGLTVDGDGSVCPTTSSCGMDSFAWNCTDTFDLDDIEYTAESERTKEPCGEFDDDHDHLRMLATSFPHLFMLGRAYDKPVGRLNHKERFHLLNQFTLVPSQDRRFLGFLFDMLQRIRIMDGVKAYVNGTPKSLRTIENLLDTKEARVELKKACSKPNHPDSKKVLNKYLPHLRFASKHVPYGAAEGAKFQWQAVELNKRYASSNNFLTISPTTLDNPRSIRMSFRSKNNTSFPATFEENCPFGTSSAQFIDNLRENTHSISEGTIQLPDGMLTKSDRANLAMDNPVAFVLENKMILNDILSILIGLDPEDGAFYSRNESQSVRKTRYYRARKGIFGHPLFAIGVTEDHSRGTLHWHLSLLSGLSPYVLQRFANLEGICDAISKVLDTMFVSRLPENTHIGHLLRSTLTKHASEWNIPDDVLTSIAPAEALLHDSVPLSTVRQLLAPSSDQDEDVSDQFYKHATMLGSYKQHHKHLKTCHNGLSGERGCRFDLPCGFCETTRGIGILPYKAPRPFQRVHTFEANLYCLPCGYHRPNATNKPARSYVIAEPSKHVIDHYQSQAVLNETLPEYMTIWQTKSPTITPTKPPNEPTTGQPTLPNLLRAFDSALKDLPNYQQYSSNRFHEWLLHQATSEQIRALWTAVLEELPGANRLVPSFNPILSYCTGSHNNASLLGSIDQAKSALFYLVPYQGKSKFPLNESLTVLNSALGHIDKKHSVHPTESGTQPRTTKHLLTRTLNRMHLKMEISDYEVAAALLDLPSVIATDRFSIGNPKALAALHTTLQLSDDQDAALADVCTRIALKPPPGSAPNNFPKADWPDADANEPTHRTTPEHYIKEDVLTSYGTIRKIEINNDNNPTYLLLPEVSLYLNRSTDLESLNYYEYLGCVGFRRGQPTQKDNPTNLHIQRHFHLLPTFVGRNDSYHVLLQKQQTPLFIGPPPKHPGKPPSSCTTDSPSKRANYQWKTEADTYARYYLTLFRPHRLGLSPETYTWTDLEKWIDTLRADNSIISKFRLMTLHQHIRGLKTKPICKKISREYRARNRKIWTDKERNAYDKKRDNEKKRKCSGPSKEMESHFDASTEKLKASTITNMAKQLLHEELLIEQMNNIFGSTEFAKHLDTSTSSPDSPKKPPSKPTNALQTDFLAPGFHLKTIQQKVKRMQDWKPAIPNPWEDSDTWWKKTRNRKSAANKIKQLRKELQCDCDDKRSSQQLELFDLYANYFNGTNTRQKKIRAKPPQILLCHGGPGVGKSVIRDKIDKAARACHRFTFKTSFNALNAIEMDGQTTSSALNINGEIHAHRIGNFSPDKIQDLRTTGFNDETIVIVEEVSNQATWHLARLSAFCQAVTGNTDRPFGGVLVLLVGDLTQLGPVKAGASLTEAVMDIHLDHDLRSHLSKDKQTLLDKESLLPGNRPQNERYQADHPYTIGTRIMEVAKWFELTIQQRSLDPQHTRLVQNNYQGRPLPFKYLKDEDYKILSNQDSGDTSWIDAPILVSTNRERHTLTHNKAIHYAKAHNTVVVRWMTKHRKWLQKPVLPIQVHQALEDPCFYEYFVEGADAFLTENIQKHLKLTNGTSAKFHSLKFDKRNEARIRNLMKQANPGDIITADEPPYSIMCEVQLSHDIANATIRKALQTMVITEKPKFTGKKKKHTTYVLPLYEYSCKRDGSPTTVRGGATFPPSKVILQRRFPIEPAFAITVHKSEGRTMEKIVIALSYCSARGCNLSYAQIHVAFSRVRHKSSIRLLLTGRNTMEQWHSIAYLGGLKRNQSVKFYFEGFRSSNSANPNLHWQTNPWTPSKANTAYRRHLHSNAAG